MNENFDKAKHTLFLQNRERLELSGIKDVDAFNEEEITALSDWGEIIIKGRNLHVEELNLDAGSLKISGTIGAFVYNEKTVSKGFFGRVFS